MTLSRAAAVAIAIVALGCSRDPDVLRMSTTTSVENSGLLNALLPAFENTADLDVQAVAVGSGRALAILENGDTDVALTHDPDAEHVLMGRGVVARYRKIMFNDFVIAGPAADPAGLAVATGALDAMRRIASKGAAFASRGDNSGTHARERRLWKESGTRPAGSALIETGSGMAATLRVASEREAYVLTDRATLAQLQSSLRLTILHQNDPLYLNTYAILVRATLEGRRLANANRLFEWMQSEDARAIVGGFRINGQPAFTVWPAGAAADRPGDLPHVR